MRCIGDVEALSPELHAQPLPYVKIAEHTGIEIRCPGSAQTILSGGSKSNCRHWGECGRVEIRLPVSATADFGHMGFTWFARCVLPGQLHDAPEQLTLKGSPERWEKIPLTVHPPTHPAAVHGLYTALFLPNGSSYEVLTMKLFVLSKRSPSYSAPSTAESESRVRSGGSPLHVFRPGIGCLYGEPIGRPP